MKFCHVHAIHLSSSIVSIQFLLLPADNYLKHLNNLIKTNVDEEIVFKPKLKSILKFWGYQSRPGRSLKEEKLEDMVLEVKWIFLREINKYIKLYFHSNKVMAPGIETYKIKQNYCGLSKTDSFWDSIGMSECGNTFHDISDDGMWQLFAPRRDSICNSIKITANENIRPKDGYSSLDYQIIFSVEDLSQELLPLLLIKTYTNLFFIKTYTNFFEKQLAYYRNKLYKSVHGKKLKYNYILRLRLQLTENLQILKRIKSELLESNYNSFRQSIKENFLNMNPSRQGVSSTCWFDFIVDSTSYLVNNTVEHANSVATIIGETIELLAIKTSYNAQRNTISLTTITVILTLLTLILTFIAVSLTFWQMPEDSMRNIVEKIIFFLNSFIY